MKKIYTLITLTFLLCNISLFAQAPFPTDVVNDSDKETERYQKEKAAWVKENPENDFPSGKERDEYQKELDKQKEYDNQVEEEVFAEGPELKTSDIPSEAITWKMIKIEVIENGEIDEKLDPTQQQIVNQITAHKLRIYIHEGEEFYVSEGDGVIKKFIANRVDGQMNLQIDNCFDCETHQISLIQFDSDVLIAEKIFDGEAGKTFVIRFTYNKLID